MYDVCTETDSVQIKKMCMEETYKKLISEIHHQIRQGQLRFTINDNWTKKCPAELNLNEAVNIPKFR